MDRNKTNIKRKSRRRKTTHLAQPFTQRRKSKRWSWFGLRSKLEDLKDSFTDVIFDWNVNYEDSVIFYSTYASVIILNTLLYLFYIGLIKNWIIFVLMATSLLNITLLFRGRREYQFVSKTNSNFSQQIKSNQVLPKYLQHVKEPEIIEVWEYSSFSKMIFCFFSPIQIALVWLAAQQNAFWLCQICLIIAGFTSLSLFALFQWFEMHVNIRVKLAESVISEQMTFHDEWANSRRAAESDYFAHTFPSSSFAGESEHSFPSPDRDDSDASLYSSIPHYIDGVMKRQPHLKHAAAKTNEPPPSSSSSSTPPYQPSQALTQDVDPLYPSPPHQQYDHNYPSPGSISHVSPSPSPSPRRVSTSRNRDPVEPMGPPPAPPPIRRSSKEEPAVVPKSIKSESRDESHRRRKSSSSNNPFQKRK